MNHAPKAEKDKYDLKKRLCTFCDFIIVQYRRLTNLLELFCLLYFLSSCGIKLTNYSQKIKVDFIKKYILNIRIQIKCNAYVVYTRSIV